MKPNEKILLVDDDQSLLDSLCRRYRKAYWLTPALGGEEGLRLLASEGPFAVVVSDYQMPGMDGIQFLKRVREEAPESVRVMLTGNADLSSAIHAVNDGQIFRFLTKPCSPENLSATLDAAIEQYRLRRAEIILLEETVQGSIAVLAEVLALANPVAFGRASRVRAIVSRIVRHLKLQNAWMYETAALLSQVGCVAIPSDIIDRIALDEELSPEELEMMDRHPAIAGQILRRIPRLERVAKIVQLQGKPLQEVRESASDTDVAIGALILSAALDFEQVLSLGATQEAAVEALAARPGAHDPRVLRMLRRIELPEHDSVVRQLKIGQLQAGMILDQDVCNRLGAVLIPRGNTITPVMIARLENYVRFGSIPDTVRIRIPSGGKKSTEAA